MGKQIEQTVTQRYQLTLFSLKVQNWDSEPSLLVPGALLFPPPFTAFLVTGMAARASESFSISVRAASRKDVIVRVASWEIPLRHYLRATQRIAGLPEAPPRVVSPVWHVLPLLPQSEFAQGALTTFSLSSFPLQGSLSRLSHYYPYYFFLLSLVSSLFWIS